jgi:hypothetical protein
MLSSRVLGLVLLAVLSAAAPGFPATAPALPTWPQSFELANGEHASFLIPVLSTGEITVTVGWRGAPLSVALRDSQNAVVTALPAQSTAPLALRYAVTQADLARGPIWRIVLEAPPGPLQLAVDQKSRLPAVRGTIEATYPDFDTTAGTQALAGLRQQQLVGASAFELKRRQLEQAASASTVRALEVSQAQRQAYLATQRSQILARYSASASTRGIGPAITARSLELASQWPSIVSLAPSNGSPGDVLSVRCVSLADAEKASVVFTFGTSTITAERAAPPVTNTQTLEVTLSVRVPKSPVSYAATANIGLTVVDSARTPALTSQPVTFAYDPFPAPIINTLDPPIVTASGSLNVRGARFQPGDQVHFILPGMGDMVSPSTTYSAETLLVARVPPFYTSDALTGQVYVVNRGGKQSGPIAIVTEANQTAVSSVYPQQASPWEDIVLSGKLLGNVSSVTYTVRPRSQQSPGTAYIADSLYSSSPKSLSIIQKSDSALVLRVAPPEGFSGPLLIDLALNGTGRAVTVPFTVTPEYIDVAYLVTCESASFDKKEGADRWITRPPQKYPEWAWLDGYHTNSFMVGHRGDDYYTSAPWQLARKYNWSFVGAEVRDDGIFAGARLNSAGVTSGALPVLSDYIWVSAHWYVDTVWGSAGVFYDVKVTLRGPRGVPMVTHLDGVQVVIP